MCGDPDSGSAPLVPYGAGYMGDIGLPNIAATAASHLAHRPPKETGGSTCSEGKQPQCGRAAEPPSDWFTVGSPAVHDQKRAGSLTGSRNSWRLAETACLTPALHRLVDRHLAGDVGEPGDGLR
jgi:hypothetical protein